jgi:hypothetical protein
VADADEFARYETVVERHRNAAVGLARASPGTVVVFGGDEAVVANATATGSGGNLPVSPGSG